MNNNNNNIWYLFFFFFIIAAAIGSKALEALLDSMGNGNRKIAIGLWNETDHPWEAISVYFSSGTSDDILPLNVKKGTN